MEFSELLDFVDNLPLENQKIFLDIANKRFAEKSRQSLITETLQSRQEYLEENYTIGNSGDLFKSLGI